MIASILSCLCVVLYASATCPDYNGDTVSLQTTFNSTRQSALCPGNSDQTIVGVAASAPVSGYLTTGPGKLRAQVATTKHTKLDGLTCRREESTFAVIYDNVPLPPNTLQGISSTTKDAALHFTATVGNGQFCSSFTSCSVSNPAECWSGSASNTTTISIHLDWDCNKSLPRVRDDVVLAFAAVCTAPAEDVAVCGNTCSGGNFVGSVSFGNLGVIDVSIRDTSKAPDGNKVRSTYTSRPPPTPLPTLLP